MLNKALSDSLRRVVLNSWTIVSLAVSMLQSEKFEPSRLHYDFNSI